MNKVILLLLLSLSSLWANEAKKIKIVTYQVPKFVLSNSKGNFVELVNHLAKKSGVMIELILMPPKRAYEELKRGGVDGLFPAVLSRDLSAYEKISSFYTKEMFAYERKGSDYRKIKGAKVCVVEGYTYPNHLITKKGWKKVFSDSDETCLELLLKKRVDLFIGEKISVGSAIVQLDISNKVQYDKYRPLSSDGVTLIFTGNAQGKKLRKVFDQALKESMIDGSFKKIFSD